jgi:hypothetical protein
MKRLSCINRIIKFASKKKIYYDDLSKFRPYLVLEFNSKEKKIGTLFITTRPSNRISLWKQYTIRIEENKKRKKRPCFINRESYINIKPLIWLLLSSQISKKIKKCYHCFPSCLTDKEFMDITNLQEE